MAGSPAWVEARAPKIGAPLADVLQNAAPGYMVSVIVRVKPASLTSHGLARLEDLSDLRTTETALRRRAALSQASLREWLRLLEAEGRVREVTSFWIFNGLALAAPREVIAQLAQRADVLRVDLNRVLTAPPLSVSTPDNLALIGAPEVWRRGITGQGVVVALLDTGVDAVHPDLMAKWRGGSNSWFDPYGEHPDEPVDLSGHGTQVLDVILGGEANRNPIGVAPGAQWIAAKIFDDRGRATVAAIHQALQWVLDPDGDPATSDAPQVVNNSWSFADAGCDPEFADDLRALRAAGILPVFAAGTREPVNPANLAGMLAVGALAEDGETLYFDSAHGPVTCDGKAALYPQLVAPGAGIPTTDRFGTSTTGEGTSLAAAHVSGALALLLSAHPSLTADEQMTALTMTAVDLGQRGPDNEFGYGRVDIAAALDRFSVLSSLLWVLAGALAVGLVGIAMWQSRARKHRSITIKS